MDVKDIMGIKGEGKATAKKSKGPAEKKPEGVSREVWQITKDAKQSGDALAPLVPSLGAGLKDKRKVQAATSRGPGSRSRTPRDRTT